MDHARTAPPAKLWKIAGTAVSLGIFVFALWLLHRALAKYEFADIVARLAETPPTAVALSLAAAAGSYLALGGFDWLAIHYLRRRVPAGLTILTSFISHGISHSAGFAALTGGAVRYRIYTAAGLTPLEVGAVIVFCGFTFILGASLLAATALVVEPAKFSALSQIPAEALRTAGLAILAVIGVYVAAGAVRRGPLRLLGRTVDLPGPRIAGLQVLIAALDLAFAAACLHALLPDGGPPLWAFVGIYVLANLAGLVAHVPGGLGVFETAVVLMLPEVPADAVLGALVLFRVTYNLVPLGLGILLMILYEAIARRRRTGRAGRVWMRELEPAGLSVLVFGAGAMLLFTGAAPDSPERLTAAQRVLPHALMQGTHLLAAGFGAGLLLVARGVFRRLADAHAAALVLLGLGGVMALLRAFDWEEAAACLVAMLLLLLGRSNFYRHRSVTGLGLNPSWIGAGASILIATGWLTLIAFRRAAEPIDLAVLGLTEMDGAGRAFRALVAACIVYVALLAVTLRQPAAAPAGPPARADLRRAAAVIRSGGCARGQRALRGDLDLMFDAGRSCFLMYRCLPRIWLAVGEPVGPERGWPDLAWAFREACERSGAAPAFLHVAHRPLYLDLGLGFSPMGEEGRVDLAFAREPAALRRGHALAAQAGATFEASALPVVARVRRAGQVVAEADLWRGGAGEIGLSEPRLGDGAPPGAESFLVVETIRWAAAHGFVTFDLGLGPGEGVAAPDHDALRRLAHLSGRRWTPDPMKGGPGVHWHPVYAALPARTSLADLAAALNAPSGG